MASTASEIIATAKTEAEAARQAALSSLSGMSNNLQSGYDTQKQATTDYYTNMMNNLQNAYNKDAKSAYATSMVDKQALSNSLNRLGLQNSGYGVSQMLGIQSQYSKNLADLQNTLATNKANTGYQEQQALADLYNTYVSNKNNLEQYLYEAGQNAYDTAYANTYQAEQDAIANALQQQYYNYLMTTANSGGGSSSSSSYESDLDDVETEETITNSNVPDGYTTSLAELVRSLGYSAATNVEKLISQGIIETDVIDGKMYYKAGPNAGKSTSSSTKVTTTIPTFKTYTGFGL